MTKLQTKFIIYKDKKYVKKFVKIYTRGDPRVRARKLFKTICFLKIIYLVLKVSSYQADHDSVKIISQKLILFDL